MRDFGAKERPQPPQEKNETMASKNNPARRQRQSADKDYQGKKVKPVLYGGSFVGHGRYIAAQDEGGKLGKDTAGKPIPFSAI